MIVSSYTCGYEVEGSGSADDRKQTKGTNSDKSFLKEQMIEKDRQITELHKQIERKDDQIMSLLERDRETNILIQGLQRTLTDTLGLEASKVRDTSANDEERGRGDSRNQIHSQDSVE